MPNMALFVRYKEIQGVLSLGRISPARAFPTIPRHFCGVRPRANRFHLPIDGFDFPFDENNDQSSGSNANGSGGKA
jgi:hypothetical protein